MNDPKDPSTQATIPGAESQIDQTLNDTQLDELSDSMLDQASGGVTSGGGCS